IRCVRTCRRPFFFSSRRRHTRFSRDWSSDVCSSDLSNCAARIRYMKTKAIPMARAKPAAVSSWDLLLPVASMPYSVGSASFANRSEERRVGKECGGAGGGGGEAQESRGDRGGRRRAL